MLRISVRTIDEMSIDEFVSAISVVLKGPTAPVPAEDYVVGNTADDEDEE